MLRRDVFRIPAGILAMSFVFLVLTAERHALAESTRLPSGTIMIEWTAPGDDDLNGSAMAYDLRYSLEPITEGTFDRAMRATTPAPARGGTRERVLIKRLMPETHYFVALKSVDESGNWSGVSNVAWCLARNALAVPPLPAELMVAAPFPNPASVGARFEITLPERDWIHAQVFDASGRRIRTLAYDEYPAGVNRFHWDLRSTAGEPMDDGVYWVRVETRNAVKSRRIAIKR